MAQLIGLARLGKDAVLRKVGQDSVINLALAFNYGRKDDSGNKPTQWVDAALWGKRADALEQYLVKGQSVMVTLDDIHIETFQGSNGESTKLVGSVSNIEFAGKPPTANQAPAPQQAPQRQQQQQQDQQRQPPPMNQRQAGAGTRPVHNFSDMDDDIPFVQNLNSMSCAMGSSKAMLRAKFGRKNSLAVVNQGDF